MFSYFQAQFAAIGHPLPTPPMWAPRPPISSPPMPGSAGSNAGAGVGAGDLTPGNNERYFASWWQRTSKRVAKEQRKGTLWKHRNAGVFDGASPNVQTALSSLKLQAQLWMYAGARGLREIGLGRVVTPWDGKDLGEALTNMVNFRLKLATFLLGSELNERKGDLALEDTEEDDKGDLGGVELLEIATAVFHNSNRKRIRAEFVYSSSNKTDSRNTKETILLRRVVAVLKPMSIPVPVPMPVLRLVLGLALGLAHLLLLHRLGLLELPAQYVALLALSGALCFVVQALSNDED
ncbi:hypothetical protein EJB05_29923, partial [Eragrostis curvula]